MSKADELLKKAAFFEKLALYSDRKSFLQAIAQPIDPLVTLPSQLFSADIKQQLGNVVSDLGALRIPIDNAILRANEDDTHADKKALIAALEQAATKYPPTASGQLENLKSLIAKLKGPERKMTSWEDMKYQEPTTDSGSSGSQVGTAYPSINKADQQAVFNFAVTQGVLTPNDKQTVDGVLGPETRKALEGVKNYFAKANPQNPRMTDQQAINAAKFQGR